MVRYDGIKSLMEASTLDEANKLLSMGWLLLDVYREKCTVYRTICNPNDARRMHEYENVPEQKIVTIYLLGTKEYTE